MTDFKLVRQFPLGVDEETDINAGFTDNKDYLSPI